MPAGREHDVVLFGATGFTGGLTAEYLARHAPDGCRWALAGRSRSKLEAVRTRLAHIRPELADLPLLHADVTDPRSLAAVASSARVVATTVGPYLKYGEPLVAACAGAGTDYLDLTGEAEFVDRMYLRYHQKAVESGARIVHAAGFDSVPYDLGVRFTVLQLPADVPVRVRGVVRAGFSPSGGTLHTAIIAASRPIQMMQARRARRAAEPGRDGRSVALTGRVLRYDGESGSWLVPMPTLDPLVVQRSASALDRYGPDFSYAHYFALKGLPRLVGTAATVGSLALAAQVPPVRRLLLDRIAQGEGPSAKRRADSWFSVQFVGEAAGERVLTEVSGGDPGYTETATMLSESALCLAFDDNPPTSGQVTTAEAMGERLTDRLVAAGISFTVHTSEAVA